MRLPALLLVASGLLTASLSWGAPRVPAVVPPPVARAGETYVTEVPRLPAGIDECELFLLPEDGSGRLIQLTPEREAHEGPLVWRMPRVNAARARLVLRAGGRFGETESEASAPFAIEPAAPREPAEVLRGSDELAWHFGGNVAAARGSLLPAGTPALAAARRVAFAAESPRGPVAELPARARHVSGEVAPAGGPDPSAPHRSNRPAVVPLRN